MNNRKVALFKSESFGSEPDQYVEILNNEGISAAIIPTLSFNFVNKELLQDHLNHCEDFQGIIFSSTRAVEAVHKVSHLIPDMLSKWRKKKNYCVGQSTARLAETLIQFKLIGEESGSSEQLCKYILANTDSRRESYLFPCSCLRKDVIPKVLSENGMHVIESICYEPVCNPKMVDLWNKLIIDEDLPQIIVFFSPSGVQFSEKMIKDSYSSTSLPKIIAIGRTTEQALTDLNLHPCKVARKPNPEAVYDAIKQVFN